MQGTYSTSYNVYVCNDLPNSKQRPVRKLHAVQGHFHNQNGRVCLNFSCLSLPCLLFSSLALLFLAFLTLSFPCFRSLGFPFCLHLPCLPFPLLWSVSSAAHGFLNTCILWRLKNEIGQCTHYLCHFLPHLPWVLTIAHIAIVVQFLCYSFCQEVQKNLCRSMLIENDVLYMYLGYRSSSMVTTAEQCKVLRDRKPSLFYVEIYSQISSNLCQNQRNRT